MTHTAHISAAGYSVTVSATTSAVTQWCLRYFGDWWTATSGAHTIERLINANVNASLAQGAVDYVQAIATDEVEYAAAPMVYARDPEGVVHAAQGGTAYRYVPASGGLRLIGADAVEVATATARLAREMLRGRLVDDGWLILHASAAVGPGGQTVLALGDKGAGKTTTALLLASLPGWSLLANDRVFVRLDGEGGVDVLPWPSAAAIGFGLLEACGWYEPVRARLRDGLEMHPTQKRQVTDALLAGDRTPLRKPNGHELKPQFWPDQLRDWLGLPLARHGTATHVLFPQIQPDASPGGLSAPRDITAADMFTPAQDDRYPDIFGIAPVTPDPTDAVLAHLKKLPRFGVLLEREVDANRAFLSHLTL
ncbi:hypothetical protein LO762_11525 [Actinocorallia sp. API 0066]|uniref:hypothetical protein n=1 Tax=Actinocorallia sp. API 0066 TaxID=2896846 RepID=UPI001E429BB1|nr:hypothetical protein [Actinocorallia sp. API 0066]MCD0449814.1 hypothetical protein [Actinocorallia sp. API 0066]